MINKIYIDWLVDWIKNGNINVQTGLPFTINDIKDEEYEVAVQAMMSV
jgi:UDP-N-acetylmuramyl pentapeptide synthase